MDTKLLKNLICLMAHVIRDYPEDVSNFLMKETDIMDRVLDGAGQDAVIDFLNSMPSLEANKIQAIKTIRSHTHLGLREAKDLYEHLVR